MSNLRSPSFQRLGGAAVMLALFVGSAGAGEVTNAAGDDVTPGGFRYVVKNALDGETITFGTTVASIKLAGTAISHAGNLTISGNGPAGFDSSMATIWKPYEEEVLSMKQGLNGDTLFWNGFEQKLRKTLNGMTASPLLDGSSLAAGKKILSLTSTDGKNRIKTISIGNASLVDHGTDYDRSGISQAEHIVESRLESAGGAVELSGPGQLDSSILSANGLWVTGGSIQGGGARDRSTYTSEVRAVGGAFSAVDAGVNQSIFRDNTAASFGGNVSGGYMLDTSAGSGAKFEKTSRTEASGGAFFAANTANIAYSVFQGNTAWSVGGTVSGGSTQNATVDVANSSFSWASGGAAAMLDGTVVNTVFQGNLVTARGGDLLGGSGTTTSSRLSTRGRGGALVADGSLFADHTVFHGNTVSVTQGTVRGGNSLQNAGAVSETSMSGNAFGGALSAGAYTSGITVNDSTFDDNAIFLTGGTVTGGVAANNTWTPASAKADSFVSSNARGGGADLGAVDVLNSAFQRNSIYVTGTHVVGGSAHSLSSGSARSSSTVSGEGGAISMLEGNVSKTLFRFNSVTVYGASVTGGTVQCWGTENIDADVSATSHASAKGGALAGFSMYGGAVSDSVFLDNSLLAVGGNAVSGTVGPGTTGNMQFRASARTVAAGGAVAFDGNGTVERSSLTRNRVSAVGGDFARSTGTNPATSGGWANADAYAFGGAVYFDAQNNSITDSYLTDNSVNASADGTVLQNGVPRQATAYARGGAVFVNVTPVYLGTPWTPGNAPTTTLQLGASDGMTTVVSGNKANGVADGIHFGSATFDSETGYFAASEGGAVFNVNTNTTGRVHLLDPVTVKMYNPRPGKDSSFVMNVNGTGRFVWGGRNVLDANGGSIVNLNGGTVVLAKDFTLGATPSIDYRTGSNVDAYATALTTNPTANLNPLVVNVKAGTTVMLDASRPADLAAFDFSGATNAGSAGIFNVEKGAVLAVDTQSSRQLLDVENTFLLASNVAPTDINAAVDAFVKGTGVGSITSSNGKIFALVEYRSPYKAFIQSNKNTYRASFALNKLVSNTALVSDAQFQALAANFNAATPEYAMSQMHFATRAMGSMADMVQLDYFDRFEVLRNNTDKSYCIAEETSSVNSPKPRRRLSKLRLWGGYMGDFSHMDRHAGYESYKMSMNGVMVGGDGKLDRYTSIGIYGAYLDETTHFRSIRSGVEAEGLQVGIVGRRHMSRGWSLTGDFGYGYFDNDGYRIVSPYRSASNFEQHGVTAGLGFEYDILRGANRIRPFLRTRYVFAHQSGLIEHGNTGTETRVAGFDANSFTTNFGVEFARRFFWRSVAFAPRFSLSWVHEFVDTHFDTTGRYTGLGAGNDFRLSSAHADHDRFVLGTDMRTSFCGPWGRLWSGVIAYDYIVSSHTDSHAVTAGLEMKF